MSQENVEIVRRLFYQWATGDLSADCFGPAAIAVDRDRIYYASPTPDVPHSGHPHYSTPRPGHTASAVGGPASRRKLPAGRGPPAE